MSLAVREWPPITDPELLQRIALDDAQFTAVMRKFWEAAPSREFQPSAFDRALGYLWDRPPASYILRGEEVQLLDEIDPEERTAIARSSPKTVIPSCPSAATARPAG